MNPLSIGHRSWLADEYEKRDFIKIVDTDPEPEQILKIRTDLREAGISNPAEAIELLHENGEERMPFTGDQVKALLGVAENEWRGMILLGYHSGIRLGDAAHLTCANLDLLDRVLVFTAGKTVRQKKGRDKETVVYMHPDLAAYFKSLPTSDNPKAPVFPSLYGKKSGSYGGFNTAFDENICGGSRLESEDQN
jgi:integrase